MNTGVAPQSAKKTGKIALRLRYLEEFHYFWTIIYSANH